MLGAKLLLQHQRITVEKNYSSRRKNSKQEIVNNYKLSSKHYFGDITISPIKYFPSQIFFINLKMSPIY